LELFDIKKWVIDENDIKTDVELEFLNKIIVNNAFTMLDKGYQLKDISLETLFQIQNNNDE
jgi:poly(3-hydroxyalkanoate) synthetase